jgi:hypothetical protein
MSVELNDGTVTITEYLTGTQNPYLTNLKLTL